MALWTAVVTDHLSVIRLAVKKVLLMDYLWAATTEVQKVARMVVWKVSKMAALRVVI